MWEVRVEIDLRPLVKESRHCGDFEEMIAR
jgi:hypothetical protein